MTAAAAVLVAGGLLPALLLACRGGAVARLVGLQLAGTVLTLALLVVSVAAGQTQELDVPLLLAVLSVTGTLVFTRLLSDTGPAAEAAPDGGEPQ